MNFLGIDIGGTFIKYGLVSEDLKIVYLNKSNTASSLNKLIDQTSKIIIEMKRTYSIKATGIGIPGFISKKDKIIKKSPNIQFLNGINFENEIRKNIDFPVFVENDANLSAFGEFLMHDDPKPQCFIHITIGTGIGSGIILNNEIWKGECGFAGELGHVIVNPEGRKCGCGGFGCIETEASETGIVNTYNELTGRKNISSLEIFELYKLNDEFAIKAFKRAGYFLGIFLCSIINFLNPSIISIGGGVAKAGDALMKPAFEELKSRTNKFILNCTEISLSAKKRSEAGILGAAYFAARSMR